MSEKNLYAWDWIGGGYNQCYAHSEAEAIAEGNSMADGKDGGLRLEINMNSFRKVEDVNAFWDNYPLFD
jgi:hypothetical protein